MGTVSGARRPSKRARGASLPIRAVASSSRGAPSHLRFRFFLTSAGASIWSNDRVAKPLWTTVAVRLDEHHYLGNVDRLVLLFRWFHGDAPPEVVFLDPVTGKAFETPSSVHWDGFPLQEAMDSARRQDTLSSLARRRSGTALDRVERCDTWMAAPVAAPKVSPSQPPSSGGRVHWSALRVWSDGREREVLVLDAQRRMTELFRWMRGRPTPGIWFVDIVTGSALLDPSAVLWDDFPEPRTKTHS